MNERRNPTNGSLSLGQVLAHRSLGLQLVTPSQDFLERKITGAHSFEISKPTRWFSPHWIALTTGMRLKGKPKEQRELITELKNAHITALGFALDVNFKAVPPAMVDAAVRCDLPIFTVPFPTGFAEIIAFVNQALVDPDVGALRRFVSVQDYLLDSLLSPNPVKSLIQRLTQLVPAEIAILTTTGQLVAASDNMNPVVPSEIASYLKLWPSPEVGTRSFGQSIQNSKKSDKKTLSGGLSPIAEFATSNGVGLAIAVVSPNLPMLWLALVQSAKVDPKSGFQLALPLIRSAGHILTIALSAKHAAGIEKRATERALLHELLGFNNIRQAPTRNSRSTLERLFDHGIDFSDTVFIACGRALIDSSDQPVNISSKLEEFGTSKPPLLWDFHQDNLVVILQVQPEACSNLLIDIVGSNLYSFGISEPVSSTASLSQGYKQARAAHLELTKSPKGESDGEPRVSWFQNCTMATWLLAQAHPGSLEKKTKEHLSLLKLEKHGLLTLSAYLDSNLDITRAASSIGIHPNSMRYRLNKIQETLGVNLDNFSELVDLYLALRATNR